MSQRLRYEKQKIGNFKSLNSQFSKRVVQGAAIAICATFSQETASEAEAISGAREV